MAAEGVVEMMGHMFGNGWYGGDWNSMPDYMKNMMQSYYGGFAPFSSLFGLIHIITWVLVVVLLVTLIRYFWNKK